MGLESEEVSKQNRAQMTTTGSLKLTTEILASKTVGTRYTGTESIVHLSYNELVYDLEPIRWNRANTSH